MKHRLLLLLFVAFVVTGYGQAEVTRSAKWAQPITNLSLKNMYKVDEGVYRCEQPNKKEFSELQQFGIKEALNLRNYHNDSEEAEGTNITLYRVDMDAHNINNKDIIDALHIIKNRKGDIIIHCKHGSDRTGVVCAMYRIVFQGWSKEDAFNELKNGGYGYHSIYFNIKKYIEKVDVENIKKQVYN